MTDTTDERAFSRQREQEMGFIPRTPFEEYREKYAKYARMERRDGILEVRLHTDDGPALYSSDVHNAWPRLWVDIGQDPDNEVLILTGTGDKWIAGFNTSHAGAGGAANTLQTLPTDAFYDHLVNDATKLMESFIFNLEIPTIACVNGPGMHTEFALMCDITLCAEHTVFSDPHFKFSVVPGDGQGLTFQELMGLKRSAWYLYTSDDITAEQAREMGLINEVLPLDKLRARGWEVAEMIMQRPRNVRRLTAAVVRRPWKRRLTQDLGFHIQAEMLAARIVK
jgi:enoyl-CoA hydratase/carnithine racemase